MDSWGVLRVDSTSTPRPSPSYLWGRETSEGVQRGRGGRGVEALAREGVAPPDLQPGHLDRRQVIERRVVVEDQAVTTDDVAVKERREGDRVVGRAGPDGCDDRRTALELAVRRAAPGLEVDGLGAEHVRDGDGQGVEPDVGSVVPVGSTAEHVAHLGELGSEVLDRGVASEHGHGCCSKLAHRGAVRSFTR